MHLHAIAAAMAVAALPVPAAAESNDMLEKRIDAVATRFSAVPITGMSIAVSRDGKLLFSRGYGYANLAAKRRADDKTAYEIGSITKEFTAAAILRLAEQGRLNLDDPVSHYFPALGDNADGVTIRHLLSHTSGLFSGPPVQDLTKPTNPADIVPLLGSRPREFAPGERLQYNNNGYTLLGLLIERVSGISYGAYLEREFFGPLNLRSTALCTEERGPSVAMGYDHPTRGPAVPRPFERHHPTTSWAAGAICSTAPDLLRWQDALVNGRVVGATSFAEMSSPATLKSGRPSRYGFGLYSDSAAGELHYYHGGAASGFITQAGYFPVDKTGVVVLTNGIYSGAIVEQIEEAVLRASRGLPDISVAVVPLTAKERALYTGSYALGPMKLEVYSQGDDLRAQPAGQVAARLLHRGAGHFTAEHDPSIQFVFKVENGIASEVIMSKNGHAMPAAKRL